MIKEVIVVEGKADTSRLKEIFPDIYTIETGGSAIDESTIELIRHAQQTRGVIILTDPDYPGMRIRSIINERVPGCKNAYIEREKAVDAKKHKIGVEHCCAEDIIEALKDLTVVNDEPTTVNYSDLMDLGYVGKPYSQDLRTKASIQLKLGYNNAKQFYRKVQMFNISYETLKDISIQYQKRIGMEIHVK